MDYFAALSAFVEAAQLGNFSRAADKLDVKASTVSRCVRDLEADLGIALFNRTTRSLALTEGRTYCIPEDVKRMAVPVLAHRVVVRSGSFTGRGAEEEAIKEVLDRVMVPI